VGYLYLSHMLVEGRPNELTQLAEVTPPGTRRVKAECEQGAAAVMGRTHTLAYVREVTIFGNALHLLVDAGVSDEEIARDLAEAAHAPVQVNPIAPSLEDVFVRLTSLQTNGGNGTTGGSGASSSKAEEAAR
jgi:hypothetical protein